MHYTYIIIGASAAGLAAAQKLRSLDATNSILCITAQQEPPFNTCLIADYLAGAKSRDDILTKGTSFFEDHAITFKHGTRVTQLDATQRMITTHDGTQYSYTKLLLATGTSLNVPPLFQSIPGVFRFHTLADVDAIHAYLDKHQVSSVVIVGAGLSGVEAADALCQRGLSVHLVEQQDHLLPRFLDTPAATFLHNLAAAHGVTVHTHVRVQDITVDAQKPTAVSLSNGVTLPAQMILLAIGGAPNLDLAHQAGLKIVNEGIIVNEFLATSDPNIYAAGDIIALHDPLSVAQMRSSTWPDAVMQGMIAAHNMAGNPKAYPQSIIMTSSRFFGTTFISAGPINLPMQNNVTQEVIKASDRYYRFLFRDQKLVGVVMIGALTAVGRIRRALHAQEVVTAQELLAS